MDKRKLTSPPILAGIIFLIFSAVTICITSRQMPPTGDEPHYLVMMHSLVMDQDISLLNNYTDQSYRIFYPGLLPKRTAPSGDNLRELPTFGLGLSLFLSPFYAIAFHFFPSSLVVFLRLVICAVASYALYQLMLLVESLTGNRGGFPVILCAALSSPLITYSSQLYPEVFGLCLLSITLNQFYKIGKGRWITFVWLAIVPGVLIWFHIKYLMLAFLIAVISVSLFVIAYRRKMERRRLLLLSSAYTLIALSGIALQFIFVRLEYGGWSPDRIYSGYQTHTSIVQLLFRKEGLDRLLIMLRMLFGFWIDQRFGILPYAPFYVAFFGSLIWCALNRPSVRPIALLFLCQYLALSWAAPLGGYSPPSRHFVVVIPLLLVPMAIAYIQWSQMQKSVFRLLQGLALGMTVLVLTHFRLILNNITWRTTEQLSAFWQWLHADHMIPSLIAAHPDWILILIWFSATLLLAAFFYPRTETVVRSAVLTS